jgi:hypothetical protein
MEVVRNNQLPEMSKSETGRNYERWVKVELKIIWDCCLLRWEEN